MAIPDAVFSFSFRKGIFGTFVKRWQTFLPHFCCFFYIHIYINVIASLPTFFSFNGNSHLQKSSARMCAEDNATTLFVIVLRITVWPPACVASTATKCCWKSQSLTPFLRGRSGCEIGVLQTNTTKRGCAVLPQE